MRKTRRDILREMVAGERPAPVLADPITGPLELTEHVNLGDPHAQYLTDAPSDGKQYARQDGTWVEVVAGVAMIAVGEYYLNITGVDPAIELGYGVWTLISTGTILIP